MPILICISGPDDLTEENLVSARALLDQLKSVADSPADGKASKKKAAVAKPVRKGKAMPIPEDLDDDEDDDLDDDEVDIDDLEDDDEDDEDEDEDEDDEEEEPAPKKRKAAVKPKAGTGSGRGRKPANPEGITKAQFMQGVKEFSEAFGVKQLQRVCKHHDVTVPTEVEPVNYGKFLKTIASQTKKLGG